MTREDNTRNGFGDELAEVVQAAGFDCFGVTDASAFADQERILADFVSRGWHGEMTWLAAQIGRRAHPKALWPDVKGIVLLGMNYGPAEDPLRAQHERDRGAISVYAKGKDYHVVVNKRLKQVAGWLQRKLGADVKVFVDTAPVMEKPLAAAAGIGWQGKHSNLVSRDFGSWLFLGAIFTTAQLPLQTLAGGNHCGGCRRCLDACPTDAFPAPYQLDARRCISYLTIEHKGPIERSLRPLVGNRVFGCDDCLAVCPWNKYAQRAAEQRFHPRPLCDNPPLTELLSLDEAAFRERFQGTPIKRAGRNGLVRNALIAAGNSDDPSLLSSIEPLLGDEAAVVRGAAIWALSRLLEPDAFARLREEYQASEHDPLVIREWEYQQDD